MLRLITQDDPLMWYFEKMNIKMNAVYGFDGKTKLVSLNFLSSCLRQVSRCLESGTPTIN